MKKRLVILNPTCLEVLESHQQRLSRLPVEIVARPEFQILRESQIRDILADASGVILPSNLRERPSEQEMREAKNLEVISIAASGYDWLDVEAATRLGILVTYAPIPVGAEVVADLTWGLILSAARQIPYFDSQCRLGNYRRGMGVSVWRKTLGIVGLGNIGKAVARRAAGFEMKILAAEPSPDADFVHRHGIERVSLEELLERSDFVSLHVRLNPQTTGMIGRRELARMKKTAYLINAARLKLVDEAALTEAVMSGLIAGIAMDDPLSDKESPLLRLPSVITTPHMGNRAIEGVDAVFDCTVDNAVQVLQGQRPAYVVNPDVFEIPGERKRFQIRNAP